MARRVWPLGLSLLLAAGGCLPEDGGLAVVSAGFFDDAQAPAAAASPHIAPAPSSEEAARRVLQVGGQILQSNPTLGVRPAFSTIGAPWEEIFHRDDKAVFITEGLVRGCRTDGQLAAVLCHELGKMAAEHQARVGAPADHGPSMETPVGKDYAGAFGPPDGTRAMELAVYERKRQKTAREALTPPDPEGLARALLEKAGGTAADLEAAAPLLRAAEEHMTFEKQLTPEK